MTNLVSKKNSESIGIGDIVRTRDYGAFEVRHSNAWGTYLNATEDPDGYELSEEEIDGIKLIPDFPKVPADLWSRWISLCFELCPETNKKLPTVFCTRVRWIRAL